MIVAEIGLNHMGDRDYALHYVDVLASSAVDAITLQVREESFYQTEGNDRFRLEDEHFAEIAQAVVGSGKLFGVALADRLGEGLLGATEISFLKLLSWCIDDHALIEWAFAHGTGPIYVSTGMSDEAQLRGFCDRYVREAARLRLIHTQLSHDIETVYLRALPYLAGEFKLPVAYGHHCSNPAVLYLAQAFEPTDVFFYIKGERSEGYPDNEHAVPLHLVAEVAKNLKVLPLALGQEAKLKMADDISGKRKETAGIADERHRT